MTYVIEHQSKKCFIGLALRTSNEECALTMPVHKEKFFKDNTLAKIPNKCDQNVLAVYTDYEGDYTKPYTWILGCEVSSLDEIPKGLVGITIPDTTYAVFTTQGAFPQGLIATWQEIWTANLPRLYSCDFEVYSPDFEPQENPKVTIYIAIDSSKIRE